MTRKILQRGVMVVSLMSLAAVAGMVGPRLVVPTTTRASSQLPTFAHVMVIMLENQGYSDVVGNAQAPFINTVLIPQYASAASFYAARHNSPTSYFDISSGRSYAAGDGGNWAGSCDPGITCSTNDSSVYQQLTAIGRHWKLYSEDQQTPCQTSYVNKYWLGHNPALFYQNLGPNSYISTGNGTCQADDVLYSQFKADLAANSVPDLAYIIPNNCDNMHDSCSSSQITQGDSWLNTQLSGNGTVSGGLIAWAQAHDTLLLITYDESNFNDMAYCCPYASSGGGGHMPLWVIGPTGKVKAGGYRNTIGYNLYSLFKTVEENWSFPLLNHANDATVQDLSDFLIAGGGTAATATPTRTAIPSATRTVTRTATATPQSATAYRREAESMTRVGSVTRYSDAAASAGAAAKAWTNGAGVTDTIRVPSAGPYTLTFRGREDYYGGSHAQVALYLDGATTPTASASITNASGYLPYVMSLGLTAGIHTFKLLFVNDAYGGSPTTDRNAYLDYLTIAAGTASLRIVPTTVPSAQPSYTATTMPVASATPTSTATNVPAATATSVPTARPTATATSTRTASLTPTSTPTSVPVATNTVTSTPTTIPATSSPITMPMPAPLFSDGFESGMLMAWATVKTGADGVATAQTATVRSGKYAARLAETATSGSYAYANATLGAAQSDLTATGDFDVTGEGFANSNVRLFRLLDSNGAQVAGVYRQSRSGLLGVQYEGSCVTTSGTLPLNAWAAVALRLAVAGSGHGTVQVWLNGSLVYQTFTASLGAAGIATAQIGNTMAGQPFAEYVDNVALTTSSLAMAATLK